MGMTKRPLCIKCKKRGATFGICSVCQQREAMKGVYTNRNDFGIRNKKKGD